MSTHPAPAPDTDTDPTPVPVSKIRVDREDGAVIKASNGHGHGSNGHEINNRSKHPIFKGQRFVVFDWQLEDLGRLLGPHLDAFEIDLWFDTLDKQLVKDQQVVPQRDKGEWLQAQCLEEAKRRGIAILTGKKKNAFDDLETLAANIRADMKAAGEM